MESKLTLKLDKNVINHAKLYAKLHNISLSKLIENYLQSIAEDEKSTFQVSSLVESLTGVVDLKNFDERKDYSDFLTKKYS